jgi:ATP-dependent exoDNAse (exonuclease V) beta subunit
MTMHASKGLEWPVVAVVTSDEERRAKDVRRMGRWRRGWFMWLRRVPPQK